MKKIICFLFLFTKLAAQTGAPDKINYQGVARDAAGDPLPGQTIGLQFKISTATNSNFYSETQNSVPTNSFGLFSTKIGIINPLPTSGWENIPCVLNVLININNTGFVPLNSQTLASVPYALYALNSGGALPTATVNGSTLRWNQALSNWQVDTNLLSNGTKVSIGNRFAIPNNKFKVITNSGSDSAAIFGYHYGAQANMAAIRGFASGSSVSSNTVNSVGIFGGHFLGYNLTGQGIGSLSQGYSVGSNGIGVIGIGSSSGTNPGNNYAVGIYATTDATSTAANKFAGIFDNGGVLIADSLLLGNATNNGNIGDVLTRSSTGRARWQTPPAAVSSPFTSSSNFVHLLSTINTDKVVIGNTTPSLFNYGSKLTVYNPTGTNDTALTVYQNTNSPGLYSSTNGSGIAIYGVNKNASLSSFAGFFDGGISVKGKNSANSGYAFIAKDLPGNVLLSIRNDGKTGIGTTTQIENFQVESTSSTAQSIISSASGVSSLYFGDGSLHARGTIQYDNSTNSMNIWTNNTANRIFIANNGFIGLKTNNPGPYDLSIFNPAGNTSIRLNNNLTTGLGLVINNGSSGTNIISYENTPFNFGNNAVTFMAAQPNGNVGIGSLAPSINSRLAIKDGHFQSQQTTAPAITGNNGTTATFWGPGGTDVTGIIQISMGATTAPGAQATVTFNKNYTNVPIVIITPVNNSYAADAVALNHVYVNATTTGFTIQFNTAYANPSYTMYFNYVVIEGN